MGEEVCFHESCCLCDYGRRLGASIDVRWAAIAPYPFRLVFQCAELYVKNDGAELLITINEFRFFVFFEKELRVGESCPQHLFVSADNIFIFFRDCIGKEYKIGHELPVVFFDGNIALVALHDIDKDFLGDVRGRLHRRNHGADKDIP